MLPKRNGKATSYNFRKTWLNTSLHGRIKKDDDYRSYLNASSSSQDDLKQLLAKVNSIQDLPRHMSWDKTVAWIEKYSHKHQVHPIIIFGILMIFLMLLSLYFVHTASSNVMQYLSDRNIRHKDMLYSLESKKRNELYNVTKQLVIFKNESKIVEFEQLLLDHLNPYCMDYLDARVFTLDTQQIETFHFNLAKIFKHVAAGGTFHHYHDMKITKEGGIIDPKETHEAGDILTHVQSCPLLEAVFDLGQQNSGTNAPQDFEDEFDFGYNWKEISEGVKFLKTLIDAKGSCAHISTALSEEAQFEFVISALTTMTEISKKKELANVWTHYVVNDKGDIHSIDKLPSTDPSHHWCLQLEASFNSKHIWTEEWISDLATETLRKFLDDNKFEAEHESQ